MRTKSAERKKKNPWAWLLFKGQKGRDLHNVIDPDQIWARIPLAASAMPKQDRRGWCVQKVGGSWQKVGVSQA